MLVANRYDTYTRAETAYGDSRSSRFSYGDDRYSEARYENERMMTSDQERDRLMNSLERKASKSRLERQDENRYNFYASTLEPADNNFDRMWDRKHSSEQKKEKKVFNRKRMPFMVAYLVLALVAVLAVSLSLVDFKAKTITTSKMTATSVSASAENAQKEGVSAAESEVEEKAGGENYVLTKNGDLVLVEIPESIQRTEEKEKGFDKFCSWLNGAFGG